MMFVSSVFMMIYGKTLWCFTDEAEAPYGDCTRIYNLKLHLN